jgi:ribose/xylose/arabinose/galactoside ABC-type transport system permease subunit
MTLGPAILLLPFVENARGLISSAIITFGRVPFFYYLAHILLIHLTAIAVNLIREGRTFSEWYATAPYVWFAEEGHQWKLSMLYIVFVIDVAILLLLCRWYERYKFTHPEQKWLRYI